MADAPVSNLSSANRRVLTAADALSLAIEIEIFDKPTRTAEEAAYTCDCAVGQIVKSLVFRGASSREPYLLLVSGKNRVDEERTAERLGEPLVRPHAAYVREVTGFAIGGIPPFGHQTPLRTFMDEDLLSHSLVYAAAGTPNSIFAIAPSQLRFALDAAVLRVC